MKCFVHLVLVAGLACLSLVSASVVCRVRISKLRAWIPIENRSLSSPGSLMYDLGLTVFNVVVKREILRGGDD